MSLACSGAGGDRAGDQRRDPVDLVHGEAEHLLAVRQQGADLSSSVGTPRPKVWQAACPIRPTRTPSDAPAPVWQVPRK